MKFVFGKFVKSFAVLIIVSIKLACVDLLISVTESLSTTIIRVLIVVLVKYVLVTERL